MKRIKDEDELKAFEKAVFEFNNTKDSFQTWREECEFFFNEGRDSMANDFWHARPKRTISRVISHDGFLYALSSDGKLFMKNGHLLEWIQLPDLPKEERE